MTVDEAKTAIRIVDLASQSGLKIVGRGKEVKVVCPNPAHNDSDASMNINTETNLFHCFGCQKEGSVVDWVMMIEGCDFRTAIEKLGVDERGDDQVKTKPPAYKPRKVEKVAAPKKKKYKAEEQYLTHTYDYTDHMGELIYQSLRYDFPDGSKEFRLNKAGGYGMDGVMRYPLNYTEFPSTKEIYFVEGEKCVEALEWAGVVATTTCGGSGGWLPEYSEYFRDKDLVLIPDNDDPGREYIKKIADDCSKTASSIKIIDIFTDEYPAKWDIADEIRKCKDHKSAYIEELREKVLLATPWVGGIRADGATPEQLTIRLREMYSQWDGGGLDLQKLFPIFNNHKMRPLVGGDVLVINASTGAGKTAMAQAIAMFYSGNVIPWFSVELSETRMHERNLIYANELSGEQVERKISSGQEVSTKAFDHVRMYDNPLSGTEYIEEQLALLPLVSGHPKLVIIDYIQQMSDFESGMTTVSAIEANAKRLKVIAKKFNVVVCVLSQIGRKDEANLTASKGSGQIEESATVLMSINNIPERDDAKIVSIYKNSNGDAPFSEMIGWNGNYYKFDNNVAEVIDELPDW